ncbi:hypothetical protein GCM10009554_81350 [Kribbella koreensis]|uniref:Mce-associated membrane protein n=1 Tax=Kribbella koreensis TaxID=57909 RepID=A0ABN1RSH0_9ACTN
MSNHPKLTPVPTAKNTPAVEGVVGALNTPTAGNALTDKASSRIKRAGTDGKSSAVEKSSGVEESSGVGASAAVGEGSAAEVGPAGRDVLAARRRANAAAPGRPTGPVTQGALALRYDEAPDYQPVPAPPVLRLVRGGPSLPDAQAWAGRLVQAVAEVLAGDRPIGQLIRFTDTVVFSDLNRRVRVLGLTTTATGRSAKERSAVRSVHVSTPATEVAEVSAHVRYGDRSRAMALRLEVHRNRWVCTALELG